MKNFRKQVNDAVKAVFGEKKKPSEIQSAEDMQKVADKYKELFNSNLDEDYKAYQETTKKAKAYDSAIKLISSDEGDGGNNANPDGQSGAQNQTDPSKDGNQSNSQNQTDPSKEGNQSNSQNQTDPSKEGNQSGAQNQNGGNNQTDLNAYIQKSEEEKKQMQQKIAILEQQVEPDNPAKAKVNLTANGFRHSSSHLFGVEHSMFSRDKRWNEIMANPRVARTSDPDENKDFEAFQNEVRGYGAGVAKRMQQLHMEGRLNLTKDGALNVDYTDLTNADLGDQFVVRRQDALIARIMAMPSVTDIFPKRYGVQDKELITNAFLGDFSQPYQSGEVWKGSLELQPEMGHVDDAMMKTLFESMKWIERQYIGYLNTSGSDPVKWTMIEWTILRIAEKLTAEQYERHIRGIFAKPQTGTAYHYLHSGTGVIYTLIRKMNEFKLLPFDDSGLSDYDNASTNFVDAVIAFKEKLHEKVDNFSAGQWEMLLNENHRHWYRDQYRSKYGTDNDFQRVNDEQVPDSEMRIRWVPNMGQLKFIIVQKPGNIQLLENLPGEMFNIKFQQDMENVKAWSVWKEGCSPSFVGKKFTSKSALVNNDFENQWVFTNKPVKEIAADETTPDVADNFWLLTQSNSGATAITDLVNKKEGKAYIVEIGGTTNTTTIAQSGLFSEITAAWNPTAVGDYIMVIWDANASKFYELERMVGGTRTVNTARQPNLASA